MPKKLLTIVLACIMAFGVLVTTAALTNAAQLGLEKYDYTGGETIFVIANGITRQMAQDKASIALFDANAPHMGWRKYNNCQYPRADSSYTDDSYVTTVAFTVR